MKLLCELLLLLLSDVRAGRLRAPASDYNLVLDNHLNVQYSGKFTIGDQSLPVIYDTGSFEVLVLSTMCDKCVKSLAMYDNRRSHSFIDGGKIAEHDFVSGTVVTAEGFETLTLGGRDSPVKAEKMTFWMVKSHEFKFWETGNAIFSGIVGLSHVKHIPEGFSGDSTQDKYLLEEMHLKAFALCLERGAPSSPGHLNFGPGVDHLWANKGAFSTVDVSGDSHWATRMADFKVQLDGVDLSRVCKPSCGALIDSGTSLLTFPHSAQHVADALKQKVRSDCSNLDQLPTLYFELDGAEVALPPKAYIFQVLDEAGNPECRGAFMEVDKESQFGEVFILGMPFLRYYYTIFDRANKKVHIARATENCQVAAPQTGLLTADAHLQANSTHDGKAINSYGLGLTKADFSEATHADLKDAIMPAWTRADRPRKIHL